MSQINLEEYSSSGRPVLKRAEYVLRVADCKFGKSKNQNNMITLTLEIVSPESVDGEDKKPVRIAGLQVRERLVFTPESMFRVKAFHEVLSLPMKIDTDSPDLDIYRGKAFSAVLISEVTADKDENTGEPILDGEGQPMKTVQYRVLRYIKAQPQHNVAMAF